MIVYFWAAFICLFWCSNAELADQLQREKINNVTFLLNRILDNYQKSLRPNMNSENPTLVYIDIFVRSMGPISELDGSYALDCYFRQRWKDERLTFSSSENLTLSLGMSMLDKIWKPDTYFWNGKGSYLHKLTTPNRLVRLSGDGSVLYSARLTIKARCPMQLEKFPLDMQTCKLIVGSFGYHSDELKYIWTKGLSDSVKIAQENKMSQFELKGVRMFNETLQSRHGHTPTVAGAEFSALEVHFLLKRHLGYFLINFYVPCTLVVLLSWVAFWINREATADRITLGVTSVLTMTFLSLDSRSDLPKVEYPTALDLYILLCYMSLFLCILEFALVHAHTKYNTGDPELRELERMRVREIMRHQMPKEQNIKNYKKINKTRWRRSDGQLFICNEFDDDGYGTCTSRLMNSSMRYSVDANSSKFNRKQSRMGSYYHRWSHYGKKFDPTDTQTNSISKIDRIARAVFPIGFAVISFLYWHTYLSD